MTIFSALKGVHDAFLGPIGDATSIADFILNLRRRYGQVYEQLPDSVKARINKGDSFQQFEDAMAQLEPHEEEAIEDLLVVLDADQAKQESFIMRAVVQGGLANAEPTIRLLKHLARKSTDEAIRHLERLDYTQPHATINSTVGTVISGATTVGTVIKTAEAKVSTAIDNSRAKKLLDRWATALENKTGIKP